MRSLSINLTRVSRADPVITVTTEWVSSVDDDNDDDIIIYIEKVAGFSFVYLLTTKELFD